MNASIGLAHPGVSWLLEMDAPGVRYLALRDLLGRPPDDPELTAARLEAHAQGPIATVLDNMQPEGYWVKPGAGYSPKYHSTVWALILLAQLGGRLEQEERIERACRYALDHALAAGGQFAYNGSAAGTFDCLQGNLCWALTELGSQDERLTAAFDWMARSQTGEGVAPVSDRKAFYRYNSMKCGPDYACRANNGLACAWGAVKVMLAFSNLAPAARTPRIEQAVQLGVDFLLGIDPATANYPSPATGKPNLSWWKLGFPVFYVTDILQIVEALARLGYGQDPRLANAIAWVRSRQDEQGRWPLTYNYASKTWGHYGVMRKPNPWVTLRALRALKWAEEGRPA